MDTVFVWLTGFSFIAVGGLLWEFAGQVSKLRQEVRALRTEVGALKASAGDRQLHVKTWPEPPFGTKDNPVGMER